MNSPLRKAAGAARVIPGGLCSQKGQALVESLIVGLLLVPMVILGILLGKYQSVQGASIAAARSLAFECTVRRDECSRADGLKKLTEELAQRHFSRVTREVFSQDQVPALSSGPERHALWTNRKGDGLLESYSDVAAKLTSGSFDAGAGVAEGFAKTGQVSDAVALLSNLAGPGKFGLNIRDGLLTADVQVTTGASKPALDTIGKWLDGFPLQFKARAAILVDDWSASKPQGAESSTVESRVNQGKQLAGAVETAQDAGYLAIKASLAIMNTLGLEKTGGSFKYHDIDMDIIPPFRRGIVSPAQPDQTVYSGF